MTSLHLFLLILLMCVAHFLDIFTSIIPYGTFKTLVFSLQTIGNTQISLLYAITIII